jgi:hypothetical protein
MAPETSLDTFVGSKARLAHRYLCSICGWEGDRMGITGLRKGVKDDRSSEVYSLGCPRCLTRYDLIRLVIIEDYSRKELTEIFREARRLRKDRKTLLQPEWAEDILALEKILLRPSEQKERT